MNPIGLAAAALIGLSAVPPAVAEVVTETDAETGARSWTMREAPLELLFKQLTLDQVRAFYLGREFDAVEADRIAHGCVFQTVARNIGSTGGITLDQKLWRLKTADRLLPIKLKEEWDREFAARGVSTAARIAFRWATFPTEQVFGTSDYIWGMTTFGLPPHSKFDLQLQWEVDGQSREAWVRSMECSGESEPP